MSMSFMALTSASDMNFDGTQTEVDATFMGNTTDMTLAYYTPGSTTPVSSVPFKATPGDKHTVCILNGGNSIS